MGGLVWQVYPRVGGATAAATARRSSWAGLSPRGRGNRQAARYLPGWHRSIPAWAGQPPRAASRRGWGRVYPRVGGATPSPAEASAAPSGLSPRGRGNPARRLECRGKSGSIPAWAGQPVNDAREHENHTVYPRVGGATHRRSAIRRVSEGLSPRGRGNPVRHAHPRRRFRSIPAWAGQP